MTDKRCIFLVFASSYQQLLLVNRKQPRLAHRKQVFAKQGSVLFCFVFSENHFYLNNYLENNKYVTLKTFVHNPSSFSPHHC